MAAAEHIHFDMSLIGPFAGFFFFGVMAQIAGLKCCRKIDMEALQAPCVVGLLSSAAYTQVQVKFCLCVEAGGSPGFPTT